MILQLKGHDGMVIPPVLVDSKSTTKKENRHISLSRDKIKKAKEDLESVYNAGVHVILLLSENHVPPKNCTQPDASLPYWRDEKNRSISYVRRHSARAIIYAVVENMLFSAYENGRSDGMKENDDLITRLKEELLALNDQNSQKIQDLQTFTQDQCRKHDTEHKQTSQNLIANVSNVRKRKKR